MDVIIAGHAKLQAIVGASAGYIFQIFSRKDCCVCEVLQIEFFHYEWI